MTVMTEVSNDFDDIVAQDVRGVLDDGRAEWLRSDENVERWYDCLNALHRSLDAQLTAKRAELSAKKHDSNFNEVKASAEEWRARTVRFKAGVQNRLAEAKQLRKSKQSIGYNQILMRERARAVREVLSLRTMILEHRDHRCGNECNDEHCVADVTLWKALDTDPDL